jgi:D-alanyl-D-alanine carboxypeptidase
LPAVEAAAAGLGARNAAASVSVWRDDRAVFHRAYGTTNAGAPVDSTTEFVQASVSKLITALTVVRLVQRGDIALTDTVPWDDMYVAHDRAWDTVTVAELMGHISGMPIAGDAWFDSRGPCNDPLGYLVALPPQAFRGRWTYSNGNYCALGLLVEHLTGKRYDDAARDLVLAPAGVTGGHITVDGAEPDDAPYPLGVGRLDRLGGAGQWVLSSDQVAAVLSTVTPEDLALLTGPGIFFDSFGWGHTGTVDGAKSCAWTVEDGRTVIVATIAGNDPGKGSWVCAVVLPALVADLGLVPIGPDLAEGQVPSTTAVGATAGTTGSVPTTDP